MAAEYKLCRLRGSGGELDRGSALSKPGIDITLEVARGCSAYGRSQRERSAQPGAAERWYERKNLRRYVPQRRTQIKRLATAATSASAITVAPV